MRNHTHTGYGCATCGGRLLVDRILVESVDVRLADSVPSPSTLPALYRSGRDASGPERLCRPGIGLDRCGYVAAAFARGGWWLAGTGRPGRPDASGLARGGACMARREPQNLDARGAI